MVVRKMASKTWICFLFLSLLCLTSFIRCEEEDEPKTTETDGGSSVDDSVVTEDDGVVTEEDDVLVLTDKNFDDVISKNKIVLVEFYAPWCGHCKTLAPEYAKAAKVLKESEPPVPLAKVDATKETAVGGKFDIQGYPTLKIFRDGQPEDYDGPRVKDGIVTYMKEKSDPNYKPPPEAVITLTKDNFKEITEKEDIMLVEFYAPWCGHCKKIAPQLETAAKLLQAREVPILIGKVDATIETDLGKEYEVQGYPTMKIFRKGKAQEYKGPRDEPGISDYMINHAGDPTTLYSTLKSVKDFMKSNLDEPVFLGVFDDESDPLYKLFLEANDEMRDEYKFGHTFSKDVKKMFALKKDSAIVVVHPEYLVSNYENRYQFYTDKAGSASAIQEFYKKYQVPLVGHFQQQTEGKFFKRPLVLVFYDVKFEAKLRSMTQFWREKVLRVAKEYPDILFAVADEESFEVKLKEFGLTDSGEDVNVGLYDEQNRRFALVDEEFSEDSLTEFIEEWKAGKLKPILKSQPVPPKAKAGKVQVVVGNSFDDIVMDENKEVFIEFYAPWCGHCKSLEPIWNKLAKAYKDEKNIVIAKIDATANDSPSQFAVSGFPTMYYALPGKKLEPIAFDGQDRDLNGFKKFVAEKSDILKKKQEKEEL